MSRFSPTRCEDELSVLNKLYTDRFPKVKKHEMLLNTPSVQLITIITFVYETAESTMYSIDSSRENNQGEVGGDIALQSLIIVYR